jgi:hypothetical protein
MKPRAQTPASPSVNPSQPPATKARKSVPVPLSDKALKQVVGGTGTTLTPQRNW